MSDRAEFRIREAVPEDVPLILALFRELAEYEKMSAEVVATEATLEQSLFGERRHAEVLLAFLDTDPVGYAVYFHNFSTFLGRAGIYLEDLFVRPELRGRGFGKRMLAYLARVALDRECRRLEWCVLNWNRPAIDFYAALGAIPMNEWTTYRLSGESLAALADRA